MPEMSMGKYEEYYSTQMSRSPETDSYALAGRGMMKQALKKEKAHKKPTKAPPPVLAPSEAQRPLPGAPLPSWTPLMGDRVWVRTIRGILLKGTVGGTHSRMVMIIVDRPPGVWNPPIKVHVDDVLPANSKTDEVAANINELFRQAQDMEATARTRMQIMFEHYREGKELPLYG